MQNGGEKETPPQFQTPFKFGRSYYNIRRLIWKISLQKLYSWLYQNDVCVILCTLWEKHFFYLNFIGMFNASDLNACCLHSDLTCHTYFHGKCRIVAQTRRRISGLDLSHCGFLHRFYQIDDEYFIFCMKISLNLFE